MKYRGVVEGLERSDREIEEEIFDKDNVLESKTTWDCHLSLWPIKRLESHILFRGEPLGVGLEEWGVIAKWLEEVPSHYFPLTIFGNLGVFFVSFLLLYHCFVILIKYSRAQRGKDSFPHYLSFCCSRAERLFEWFEVFLLCLLYENSIKLPLKGDSSLNGPGHSLMLGANHSLCIIGVSFQLYGQLKKSPHDGTGVLGSTAISTVSQATRLGKSSSVMEQDECMP